jgi:carboxypeptidase D
MRVLYSRLICLGAMVYDPCIGQFIHTQENVPVVPFVKENLDFFDFDSSFLSQIESLHESCGYADYLEKYLTFPTPGHQPTVSSSNLGQCDLFNMVYNQANTVNECFNVYEVNQTCPTPVSCAFIITYSEMSCPLPSDSR